MPSPRLIPRVGIALAVIVVGLGVLITLGVLVHGLDHGLAIDNSLDRWVHTDLDVYTRNDLVATSDPPLIVGLLAMVGFVAVLRRRWDVLALTVLTPLLTTGLTERVFKPLFDRTNATVVQATGAESLAYPSGHESAVSALLVLVGLVVLTAPLTRAMKAAWLAVLALYFVLSMLGLVGAYYHFPTDTVGSLGLALAVVPATGLAVDQVRSGWSRRSRQSARSSRAAPRTSPRGD